MSKSPDSPINGKYKYRNEKTNYYDLATLDYYKPNVFNESNNLPSGYHV